MQTINPAQNSLADLSWLAFILTGHRRLSVDLTLEVLSEVLSAEDVPLSSLPDWLLARARRAVITTALASVRRKLASSARRTAAKPWDDAILPSADWSLHAATSRVQIEDALLAIELFPRCALLLIIFEGISLAETSVLLNVGRDVVLKGQIIGLREMTRNLAKLQGWPSQAAKAAAAKSEIHA